MAASEGLEQRIARLREILHGLGQSVVCFSGGVDSAYLLAEAAGVLGDRVVALTAVSPSLAPEEGEEARRVADGLGVRHLLVDTRELDDPRYAANGPDRCYWCKTTLYDEAVEHALSLGIPTVLDGFNRDDRGDHRPGRRAARERGVRSPLDEAGLDKADVREGARRLGLPVWDKPALACLASRLPYGTSVTADRLRQIWRAESALRRLGFRVLRVRHHGEVARVEVAPEELPRLLDPAIREAATEAVREAGFKYVAADLLGYRSGALNEGLAARETDVG